MIAKLATAAAVGLLLSGSLSSAVPLNGLVSGESGAEALILVRHSGSSGSSSSSSSSSSSWSSHRSAPTAPRASAPPRTYTAPPSTSRSWSGPRYSGAAPRWGGPPVRYARRHIPIRLLAPLFLAGAYYYPYRYMPYEGPVCGGVSDNGCQLQWTEVPLEDSDETSWQCVEFCPQQ